MIGREETKKWGFDRKTVLVGLIIALLFIGGGVYAWQNSILKGSIGKAVQVAYVPDELQEQEKDNESAEYAGSGVRREDIEVIRVKNQFIEVVSPNGGETFCLGSPFDITWRSRGIRKVHVLLESEHKVYNLGIVPADGSVVKEKITVPPEGNLYRLVVISGDQEETSDMSDTAFAIQDCTE